MQNINQTKSSSEEQSSKKKPRRNIISVLTQMVLVIPDEGDENFKSELEKQIEKASYTAPENTYTIWENVQGIITHRFKDYIDKTNLPEWCVLLIDIWTDRK
jgi:hypothetical protein